MFERIKEIDVAVSYALGDFVSVLQTKDEEPFAYCEFCRSEWRPPVRATYLEAHEEGVQHIKDAHHDSYVTALLPGLPESFKPHWVTFDPDDPDEWD